jgi:hypothetical protein
MTEKETGSATFSPIIAAVDALKNSRSFGTYTSMCQHVNDGKAVFR